MTRYEDPRVVIDDSGLSLRWCYFPVGSYDPYKD